MCTPDELAGFALLADLSPPQLDAITELARSVTFDAGSSIIHEGHDADRCWLISSGLVALEMRRAAGKASTVQTLGAGDVLGWSWLLPPYKWRFDAVATVPVTAIELDAVRLRALADQDCSLGYALALRVIEVLADRLHGTRARLIDLYGIPRGQ